MDTNSKLTLREQVASGGKVLQTGPSAWRLEIPSGSGGRYRLAQLDDYAGLSRRNFPWEPPLAVRLRMRVSKDSIPGTWGFGLWNDPFGMTLVKGTELRLPTLPNAAWFFFASPPNYLSLRDDLPAYGKLAATFQSPLNLPTVLILRIPLLALFFLPPVVRYLRKLAREYVHQASTELALDPTQWHEYEIDCHLHMVRFCVDGKSFLETEVVPQGCLGLVAWVDNQYASLSPDGRLRYGTLTNDEAVWLEIEDLRLAFA